MSIAPPSSCARRGRSSRRAPALAPAGGPLRGAWRRERPRRSAGPPGGELEIYAAASLKGVLAKVKAGVRGREPGHEAHDLHRLLVRARDQDRAGRARRRVPVGRHDEPPEARGRGPRQRGHHEVRGQPPDGHHARREPGRHHLRRGPRQGRREGHRRRRQGADHEVRHAARREPREGGGVPGGLRRAVHRERRVQGGQRRGGRDEDRAGRGRRRHRVRDRRQGVRTRSPPSPFPRTPTCRRPTGAWWSRRPRTRSGGGLRRVARGARWAGGARHVRLPAAASDPQLQRERRRPHSAARARAFPGAPARSRSLAIIAALALGVPGRRRSSSARSSTGRWSGRMRPARRRRRTGAEPRHDGRQPRPDRGHRAAPRATSWRAGRSAARRSCETVIDLPIVLPPSVAGLALLLLLGRRGVLGEPLAASGFEIPFTTLAVVDRPDVRVGAVLHPVGADRARLGRPRPRGCGARRRGVGAAGLPRRSRCRWPRRRWPPGS